jgi:hypothetical protein
MKLSLANEYVTIPTQVIKYSQNFLQADQPIRLQNSNQIKLFKIRCLLYLLFLRFLLYTNIQLTFHMWSCQLTLRSWLTVQSYARQLNILTNQTKSLGVCWVLIPREMVRFDANLSVENMTPDSLCKMLLEVCVSQKIKLKKTTNI